MTILFPSALTCMVLDPAERAVYVGTSKSVIHQFTFVEGVGGQYVPVEGDPAYPLQSDSQKTDFVGHSGQISAINLSFDGALLISGDDSGEAFVWDIGSRQVLRKLKGQNGNPPSSPPPPLVMFLFPSWAGLITSRCRTGDVYSSLYQTG
jgi:pre-rRNA-processing protein IPI3